MGELGLCVGDVGLGGVRGEGGGDRGVGRGKGEKWWGEEMCGVCRGKTRVGI